MQTTIQADKVFTGEGWLYNQEMVIREGRIEAVRTNTKKVFVSKEAETFLAPAFVDFQVYGAAQKLFALYPSVETLQAMQAVFSSEGTCLFQPTLATNSLAVFKNSIDAVAAYWASGGEGVAGLHLEGPWIHPAKRGAHLEQFIHAPTLEEVKEIVQYGKGVIKTITLAPEVCSEPVLDFLLSSDIIVSAGHSNATYQQAMAAFEKGIPAVTHLYNAMSPLHHREPGLVGAALQHRGVVAAIIPDGHHVDYAAIAIAKKIMGDRLFAITDAVTETTEGAYQHQRVGDKFECNGTLSGSAISMYDAFYNLVTKAGIAVEEALRMCSLYPARLLKCEHLYGKIAPGFAAQFITLNQEGKRVDTLPV